MGQKKLVQIILLLLLPILTFGFTQLFYVFTDGKKTEESKLEKETKPESRAVSEFKARIKERKDQTTQIEENIEDLQLEIRNLKDEKKAVSRTLKLEQFIYATILAGHLRVTGDSMTEALYPTIEAVARINSEANDSFADVVILGEKALVQLSTSKLFGKNQKNKIIENQINRLDKLVKKMADTHDLKKLVLFLPNSAKIRRPSNDEEPPGDEEEDDDSETDENRFERLEGLLFDRYQTVFEKIDVRDQKSGDARIVFEVVATAPVD